MEVVQLRQSPTVNDIPAQLRAMADQFERGEIQADGVLFIVPQEADWPMIFGWGDHLSDYGNIAICELAKTWFVNNLVARG